DSKGRSMAKAQRYFSPTRKIVADHEIANVNRPRIENRPAGDPAALERRMLTDWRTYHRPEICRERCHVTLAEIDRPVRRIADAGCVLQHLHEDGFEFADRAADDSQDLRGGGLLLQRFT